jgi:hypothetical protein
MKKLYRQGAIGQFIHGEGEYIHKTVPIWHELTYGEPNHWRNLMYSTFYCTHSMGPMMTITGTRPVTVVGFETPNTSALECGMLMGSTGMEICQMDNGATVKSLHASSVVSNMSGGSYSICGPRGMIESDRWGPYVWNGVRMRLEQEGGKDLFKDYQPDFPYQPEPPAKALSHGGADVAMIYFFIDKILDKPQGDHCIDVYEGIDMSIVGILAYRSILAGNVPLKVPDFRNKEEREKYRGDNFGFDPKVCGDQLAPSCSFPIADVPDSVYERMRRMNEEKRM